ncbi:acetyl/propionyl/methylcrotonyl-CoA carboxylase subunit alpha [Parafrigoribacterium soli]|uniref:acetyl/propionyl/methylcrotonyl-CoA carboxylase subunit alpha n=1 Tax=Parafrigoribacterium soli TaxID=3144663 RepID=UPI0032EC74F9
MFERVLIANRGEIACRVIRTLRDNGIRSIAVYSDADRGAKHVAMADEAVRIGPAPAHDSYLNADAIIAAARASGAQAIHPGYGFLSENAEFAEKCAAAGIVFIGPGVTALGLMGDKIRAKQHVSKAGVPVIEDVSSPGLSNAELEAAAIGLGFPILVKPSAGGGGKGMVPVLAATELTEALATARRIASAAFGDDTLLLERLVTAPRHIEVQLLADTHGNVIHLGERECSLQRRHQKVIEEAPSPLLSAETRARIGEAACTVARSVDYVGAGTVEFLVSADAPDEFFFMEMNTRLQVEHPVTELVTGVDLVEWQLRVAAGERLTITQDDVTLTGHAIEARVYAEDPESGFLPSTGTVIALAEARGEGVRVDSSLVAGLTVSPHYDPMLAKVIAWGPDRDEALTRLDGALGATTVLGVRTNVEYLRALLADPDVRSGDLDTTLIERRLPTLAFRHPDVALLAVAALYQDAQPHQAGVWHTRSGWRMGGTPRASRFCFATSASDRADVLVAGATVTIDGTEHSARIDGDGGTVRLELDGVSSAWAVAREGDTLWLGQRGFSWPLGILSREAQAAELLAQIDMAEKPRHPEVRSPMPGTVVTVSVADGDLVEAGDTILTVEAMKMEHKLTAPVAGTVSITATPGDLVKLDQLLASITVTSDTDTEEKS